MVGIAAYRLSSWFLDPRGKADRSPTMLFSSLDVSASDLGFAIPIEMFWKSNRCYKPEAPTMRLQKADTGHSCPLIFISSLSSFASYTVVLPFSPQSYHRQLLLLLSPPLLRGRRRGSSVSE